MSGIKVTMGDAPALFISLRCLIRATPAVLALLATVMRERMLG